MFEKNQDEAIQLLLEPTMSEDWKIRGLSGIAIICPSNPKDNCGLPGHLELSLVYSLGQPGTSKVVPDMAYESIISPRSEMSHLS